MITSLCLKKAMISAPNNMSQMTALKKKRKKKKTIADVQFS